jgi:[ribosomal protein S5]-alanine N-acetyltransferase
MHAAAESLEGGIPAGPYRLRRWSNGDIPALVAACQDSEIARWLRHIPQPYTEANARAFVRQANLSLAAGVAILLAVVDSSGDLLGSVGLHLLDDPVSLGYWVVAPARGRAVAAEATRGLVGWAFRSLPLERIVIYAQPDNIASQRVAEKSGFDLVACTARHEDGFERLTFALHRPDEEAAQSGSG